MLYRLWRVSPRMLSKRLVHRWRMGPKREGGGGGGGGGVGEGGVGLLMPEVEREAPLETIVGPSFSTRLTNANPRRLPNRLMMGSYDLP